MLLEVLSNFHEYNKKDLLDAETLAALHQIETQLIDGKRVAKLLSSRLLQVKKRFLRTILALIDDDFFTRSEASSALFALKRNSFEKCIAAAYDLRSRYVHTGIPFGAWISLSIGGQDGEVRVGTPVVEQDRELGKIIGRAPTLVGLERVTRYVLLRAALQQGGYVAPIE